MGSHVFLSVEVPVLWGTRAVLQDPQGRLTVIDLGGERAKLEVLEDEPAQGILFAPRVDGFVLLAPDGTELYKVNPTAKSISAISLELPPVTIARDAIRIGTNTFQSSMITGAGVGFIITENSIAVAGPLPSGLAALRV
jgi:hypothetical protein